MVDHARFFCIPFGLGLALFTWVFERARPLLLIEFFCLCFGLMWGDFLNIRGSISGLVIRSAPIAIALGYSAFRLEKSRLSAEAREYVWGTLAGSFLIVAFELDFPVRWPIPGILGYLVEVCVYVVFLVTGWTLFSPGQRLAMVPWSVLAGLVLLGKYYNVKDHLAVGIGLWIGLSLVQMALVYYLRNRGTHGKSGPKEPNANDGSAG